MNIHRILRRLILIVVGLFICAGCAVWTGGIPLSYQTGEKYPIISSVHGVKHISDSADLHELVISYTPTNEITLNTNTTHGWRIHIKPVEKRLTVTEFYILPKPARWGHNKGEFVSPDNTTCFRSIVIPKNVGYIDNDWGMYSDDPIGEYRIVVLIDDKFAADFRFRVIAGAK